jgi:DNA-binding LacI/PurR family transcriptional regulator
MGNELAGRLAARYLIQSKCDNPVVLTAESLNPGFSARIEGFRFEFFTNKMTCDEMRLSVEEQSQAIEICDDEYMEAAIENMLSKNKLEQYDGIFSPEERLTPFLHRGLLRIGQKKWPLIISCNHTPEYLAGLYPRPASIDLGPQMLAELALKELFRRISGEQGRKDNLAVITTPTIVPGDPV